MSWSVQTTSQTAATIEAAARQLFNVQQSTVSGTEEERAATSEQFEAALSAAQAVLASGAVGESPVMVNLSGHANPGHVHRSGWANDTVTISIAQH
jgi:hypothetical protein